MGEVAKTGCLIRGPLTIRGIILKVLAEYERTHGYRISHDDIYLPDLSRYGRTTVVQDVHTRKKMMMKDILGAGPDSGFIGLPGDYGTIEELFGVITWNQLGIHRLGVCLLDTEGHWNPTVQWVNSVSKNGFVK